MKLRIQIILTAIAAIFGGQGEAQPFADTSLYRFSTASITSPHTNADGISPRAGLILVSNTMYGMTYSGGSVGYGTIFKLNADGSGFTNLYNFTNGVDGGHPSVSSSLAFCSNKLFGVTSFGGTNVPPKGAVFAINSDGTGFSNIYSFHGNDGQNPAAGLIVSGGILYGTTISGGGSGKHGTVFKINVDGSGFTNLYLFSTTDGSSPSATLTLSGNTLFGTTFYGSFSAGTVFRINTDGSDFTNLYSFTGGTNGSLPYAGVGRYGNWLFGTTSSGGAFTNGIVYRIHTDGTGFTNLHNFTGGNDSGSPFASLVLVGDTLYGTALAGKADFGTVYAINTDGTGFTNLYEFSGSSDGAAPGTPLILSGNTFYGTTDAGGSSSGTNGNGVIFGLTFPVSLSTAWSGSNCTISWPSPSTGFSLRQNNDLATTNWTNSNFTTNDDGTTISVTNSPLAGNLFFRLNHP